MLFGGNNDSTGTSNGETWEWNGTTWTQRLVSGPSPRYSPAMAYDAIRRVTVLFGGFAGAPNDETWVWNGETWTQQFPNPHPSPRCGHAMTYDAARCVIGLLSGLKYASPGSYAAKVTITVE